MAATRRLQRVRRKQRYLLFYTGTLVILFRLLRLKELQDMRKADPKHFKNIIVDESNILYWKGLIVPVSCIELL